MDYENFTKVIDTLLRNVREWEASKANMPKEILEDIAEKEERNKWIGSKPNFGLTTGKVSRETIF